MDTERAASDSGVPPSKKLKTEPVPFTERKSSDDVRLCFDDGKDLYAHPAFLSLASPVFNAMFEHDFLEKQTRTIALHGKKYDDFLKFLLCLHPGQQLDVDRSNVFKISGLANEYQVPSIESKCQAVMELCLAEMPKRVKHEPDDFFNELLWCLCTLLNSLRLNYEAITTKAIEAVARFGISMYTEHTTSKHSLFSNNSKAHTIKQKCIQIFNKFSDSIKAKVFFQRLKYTDKNNMVLSTREHAV